MERVTHKHKKYYGAHGNVWLLMQLQGNYLFRQLLTIRFQTGRAERPFKNILLETHRFVKIFQTFLQIKFIFQKKQNKKMGLKSLPIRYVVAHFFFCQ